MDRGLMLNPHTAYGMEAYGVGLPQLILFGSLTRLLVVALHQFVFIYLFVSDANFNARHIQQVNELLQTIQKYCFNLKITKSSSKMNTTICRLYRYGRVLVAQILQGPIEYLAHHFRVYYTQARGQNGCRTLHGSVCILLRHALALGHSCRPG